MHTQDAERPDNGSPGVGDAAKHVAQHASSLAKLELELATLELKRKLAALGKGAGLGAAAAVFALYAFGFLLATVAAALGTFLPGWLALLIVTVVLLAVAGVLGLLALKAIKRGTPPVPRQAIDEARQTTTALKS